MRVVRILISKPSDFTFEVESSAENNLVEELTEELKTFGFTPKPSFPSPRRYPPAIRLIGATHYWSNGMVWACLFNKHVKIILIPEKILKNMNQYEYDDYQRNYDLQNEIINHFYQILTRNT